MSSHASANDADRSEALWKRRFALQAVMYDAEYAFLHLASAREVPESARAQFDAYYAQRLAELHPDDREDVEKALWAEWNTAVYGGAYQREPVNWHDLADEAYRQELLDKANQLPRRIAACAVGGRIDALLSTVPQGREKAIGMLRAASRDSGRDHSEIYRALVWLDQREVDVRSAVERARAEWLDAYRTVQKSGPWSQFFWPRRPGEERLSPLHHMAFALWFGVEGFDHAWAEVSDYVAGSLLNDPPHAIDLLLLLSWDPSVAADVLNEVQVTCKAIVQMQEEDGSWRMAWDYSLPSSAFFTAIMGLFLQSFAPECCRTQIARAVDWLLPQQGGSEAWMTPARHEDRVRKPEEDLIATCAAALLLHRVAPHAHRHALGAALRWIWTQQPSTGAFDVDLPDGSSPFKFIWTTILVLDVDDTLCGREPGHGRESKAFAALREIKAMPTGKRSAYKYQASVLHLLQDLFGYALSNWTIQQSQDRGLGLSDIMADIHADDVFFADIKRHFGSLSLPIECKNERQDLGNSAFNQIANRLGRDTNRFGMVVCRRWSDEARLLQHLSSRWAREGKMILALDDAILEWMVGSMAQGRRSSVENVLRLMVRSVERGAASYGIEQTVSRQPGD